MSDDYTMQYRHNHLIHLKIYFCILGLQSFNNNSSSLCTTACPGWVGAGPLKFPHILIGIMQNERPQAQGSCVMIYLGLALDLNPLCLCTHLVEICALNDSLLGLCLPAHGDPRLGVERARCAQRNQVE